jgi:hypothetical protein
VEGGMADPEIANLSSLDFMGYRIVGRPTGAAAHELDPSKIEPLTSSDPVVKLLET